MTQESCDIYLPPSAATRIKGTRASFCWRLYLPVTYGHLMYLQFNRLLTPHLELDKSDRNLYLRCSYDGLQLDNLSVLWLS